MAYKGYQGTFYQQKFGYSPDIDAGDTDEEVWDGTGTYGGFLAAATSMTISSDDANDTAAGTGARTIEVTGLTVSGSDWIETKETVTLTGLTEVSLSNDYIRVYRLRVLTAGSGNVNAGAIYVGSGTVTAGVPANVYAQIRAGRGQTNMAVWTLPSQLSNGETVSGGSVRRWYASIGAVQSAFAVLNLQIRAFGGAWQTKRIIHVAEGGALDELITWGLNIAPKTDVRILAESNGVNNSTIAAGFDVEIWA